MVERRMGIIAVLLCFFLSLIPCKVQAVKIEIKEPISTDTECELTVSYRCDGQIFGNETVKLYLVADVAENVRYTLQSSFAASGLELNGIQTNSEWNAIRSTLDAYILANNTQPIQTAVTDEQGQAVFTKLKPGLYLASYVYSDRDGLVYYFDSALVAVPGLNNDGLWQYRIAVAAKPEMLLPVEPDDEIERRVLKLWKGDEGKRNRPLSIEVEIYRNEEKVETVMLSDSNRWSYSWTAKADGASWKVAERNVPKGYTVTLEERGTTFVLTNTLIQDEPDPPTVTPPKTGDASNILLYTLLMLVSGGVLIALGLTGKRKRDEKTN